jgi:hypothetical protein
LGAGVFGFLTTREARALRLVNRECLEAVAAARWHDPQTRITGSLAAWRACFPGAVAANVDGRHDLRDSDFAHLAPGIHTLNMSECHGITDAGLARLAGIHTLDMRYCTGITDAGLARLAGIHTLNICGCSEITNVGLEHLTGIRSLDISRGRYGQGPRITDTGLAQLSGIHSLRMHNCRQITDAGVAHLSGIHALDMSECIRITNA